MRVDKDGVVHFDTGGGNLGGHGDGSGEGGGYNDSGGGGGAPDTSYDLETTAAYSAPPQFDLSNYSDEASGLQAGAYSPAVAQAIVDMMSTEMGANPASGKGFHSPGLSYATLAGLEKAGYGKTDIPGFDQNIEQALAAQNVHNILDYAFPGLANALVPGFGTLSSVSKALVGLHQGYLSPAQALAQIGLGILSGKTNIPEGALQQAFSGQYGPLAGGIAQSGLAGAIGQAIGAPAGLVNMGLGAAGVGKSISGAMSDVKGPDLLGPSLDSVGVTTPSTEPSGTAGGGASTSDAVMPPVSSVSSDSPRGLVALLGGASSDDEEKEQANMADVRRGIAMTPYGMPYGG